MAEQDKGIVTAYGAAVRGGYTGTYDEFCDQLANSATYAQETAENAERAEEAAETAQGATLDKVALITDGDGTVELKNVMVSSSGDTVPGALTFAIKRALLACFANVAWINTEGKNCYDNLTDTLLPPDFIDHISAVYTQSRVVYDNQTLDVLKQDLVVTAYFNDSSSEEITDYVLSGSLTEGTSTITASFMNKTASFTVTVTHYVEQTSFLSDARYWNYKTEYVTMSNRTSDGFTATVSEMTDAAWIMEGGNGGYLFVHTDDIEHKTIRIAFDVEMSGYTSGNGLIVGAASCTNSNPTYGGIRSGTYERTFTESGSYDFTFDVDDTNLVISPSQYLGLYIYIHMNANASVTISNLVGTVYV